MSKKFSIVEINTNKLNDEIDEYIQQTGETNLSLCMHIDTMYAISRAFPATLVEPIHIVQGVKGAVRYWEGQPVFIDNNLKFGEIEIKKSRCEHEWHVVGSAAGTKSRYEVFVCPKCGEQQTRRTSFNKEKNGYIMTILNDEDWGKI